MIPLQLAGDGSLADFNFQQLMGLVIDTGGVSLGIRCGFVTVSFSASTVSGTETVDHGLGRTPLVYFVGNVNISGVASITGFVEDGSGDETSFDALASASTSITQDVNLSWWVAG